MNSEQVVRELWQRISARDWSGVGALLSPDVRVDWPATGETFVGVENFVAIQSEYPEGWTINVLRVIADGQAAVSEVEVPHDEFGIFRAASFWTVSEGLIRAGIEYWITVAGESPPSWRARYSV